MLPTCKEFKAYVRCPWNRFDQAVYGVMILAVILRFTLNNDEQFEWARNVYAIDLIMFCLRTLQLYLVHRHLGPKLIMISRMVDIPISFSESSLFVDIKIIIVFGFHKLC